MAEQERRTFVVLKLAGLVFLVALLAYAGYSAWTHPFVRDTPQVLGVGSAFQGNAQLPKAEIDSVLTMGREKVADKNRTGNIFSLISLAAGWLSFLLTSLITLVAGYHGIALTTMAGGAEVAKLLKKRSANLAKTVGLLAATAAVCTALGGRASSDAERYYKQADEFQLKATQGRKEILDAPTANDALDVLDRLRKDFAR
jgi:hypothetical protein